MGLFSSKIVITAYAGSATLIEEDSREHTIKSMILQSVISGATTSAEAITLGLRIDMYARVRSMIRYAERPDGYYYGLPEATHNGDDKYLPIAVLMHDQVWWDDEVAGEDDPLEATTVRLLKKLALDAYDIKDQYINGKDTPPPGS